HDTAEEETINQNQSVEQSNNRPKANEATEEKKQAEAPVEEKLDIRSSVAEAMKNRQDATSIQTIAPQKKLLQNKPTIAKTMQSVSQITKQQSPMTPPSRIAPAFAKATAGRPIAMTKKTPSLAQLTQGVLNYVKDEGQYAVSMIG